MPSSTSDEGEQQPSKPSRRNVIAIVIAACTLAVAGFWATVQRPAGGDDSLATTESAAANAAPDQEPATDGGRAKKPKPPKLELVWNEVTTRKCPNLFSGDIRVIVVKGTVERATVSWRAHGSELSARRILTKIGDEWTLFLTAIPANINVTLTVKARGPGGQAIASEDISHWCQSSSKSDSESAYLDYFG
ncbi:MAG: hypothetical protein U0990_06615 [Candidatus Nanopelagicales bacterium]|nr:hypothetical protein [Candidatus Nanopelagicales bacterium]MDZ4249748.1 hypothetical protein [Candidatus Nanopelagicales bacterium]